MPRRPSRRNVLFLISAALSMGFAAVAASGPLVRAGVERAAARRGLTLRAKRVGIEWSGIVLHDVDVRGLHEDVARARLPYVRLTLAWPLRVGSIDVRGGELSLSGSVSVVMGELALWRAASKGVPEAKSHGGLDLHVANAAVRWHDANSVSAGSLLGVSVDRLGDAVAVRVDEAHLVDGGVRIGAEAVSALTDAVGMVRTLVASSATVEWVAQDAAESARCERTAPDAGQTPPMPETGGLQRVAAAVDEIASEVTSHTRDDAQVRIDALTWRFASQSPALALGPGPFTLLRSSGSIDVQYTSDTTASSTSLRCSLRLPIGPGDASLSVQGGPVSLAQLGIAEGAAGLLSVASSSFMGGARVVFDGRGGSLVFDVQGSLQGVGIRDERLAPQDIEGLDVFFAARGAADHRGILRLDDVRARLGAAQVAASGLIQRRPDSWAASVDLDIPPTNCAAAISSIPVALVPALQGSAFDGSFAAHVHVGFDTRNIDALALGYTIRDTCRAASVTDALARERFRRPFEQKVYLPDGSIGTMLTGPGTPEWSSLDSISPFMQVAVLTTEDGAFYRHHGFSTEAIRASLIANLKAGRFVRGASTISMQLAKNLFLSRGKTLSRKLEEIILTEYLEQEFSKQELMELYLNVVELGPGIYGVTEAADYYFGRTPAELTLPECIFLATLLPSPLRYSRMREHDQVPDAWMRTIHTLMNVAHQRELITGAELTESMGETVSFWHGGSRPAPRPPIPSRPIDGVREAPLDDQAWP